MAGSRKRHAESDRLFASYRHELAIAIENSRLMPMSPAEEHRIQWLAQPGAVQARWAAKFWHTTPAGSVSPAATAVVESAARHGGVDLHSYDPEAVMTIAQSVAAYRGLSVQDWLEVLAADADEPLAFAEALCVANSAFFRRGLGAEADPFVSLAGRWLPALARAHPERPLRVWSAGIGRGEEAWSLAILAAELEAAGYQGASVLGTDVRPTHIEAAEEGRYSSYPALTRVSDARRQAWFAADGPDHYQVADDLRPRVRFAQHDLVAEPFTGPAGEEPFDLIVCRHVLMAFTAEARRRVLAGLAGQLDAGGLLVLDHTVPDLLPGLVPVDRQARIWRKG